MVFFRLRRSSKSGGKRECDLNGDGMILASSRLSNLISFPSFLDSGKGGSGISLLLRVTTKSYRLMEWHKPTELRSSRSSFRTSFLLSRFPIRILTCFQMSIAVKPERLVAYRRGLINYNEMVIEPAILSGKSGWSVWNHRRRFVLFLYSGRLFQLHNLSFLSLCGWLSYNFLQSTLDKNRT